VQYISTKKLRISAHLAYKNPALFIEKNLNRNVYDNKQVQNDIKNTMLKHSDIVNKYDMFVFNLKSALNLSLMFHEVRNRNFFDNKKVKTDT